MQTPQTKQYNVKLPLKLAESVEAYAAENGYRNVQELISESLREKIESLKIALLEQYLKKQIEEGRLISEEDFWKQIKK